MRPRTVQKEGSSVNQLLYHIVLTYISRIVARYEVRLTDQVCGFNLLMSETQVGHGHTAGLLGIIIKVCLSIHIGIVADDLDGVLVRSNRTVSAKSPELAVRGSFGSGYQFRSQLQGQIGNVVFDTDGEFLLFIVVVNGNDLSGSGILGAQSVTSGENRNRIELAALQSCNHIQV